MMPCKEIAAREPMILDTSELLDRVGGDMELAKEIAAIFLDEYPALLASIRTAVASDDAALLERSAHSFKGAVSNFGAHAVTQTAFHLERLGRQRTLECAVTTLERLEDDIAALLPALSELVGSAR